MITLKPWFVTIALVLILRYTGAISGISYVAQSAAMKTGLMDADTELNTKKREAFDYRFTVKDLEGNTVNMEKFKGKVVFLNLWATWCGPCRAEMPSIEALYKTMENDEVVFILLSLDRAENFNKVVKYVDDRDFTFPVYVVDRGLPEQLQVPSIPTTFVIGKDGTIQRKEVGTANYDTPKFKQFLKTLSEENVEKNSNGQ
ncbi:MAG TPA: TlpA disulfide reductase family protein [Chryseosolibacter sp.]